MSIQSKEYLIGLARTLENGEVRYGVRPSLSRIARGAYDGRKARTAPSLQWLRLCHRRHAPRGAVSVLEYRRYAPSDSHCLG